MEALIAKIKKGGNIMIEFRTYEDSNQVEYYTGLCRHCGMFNRYYPEDFMTPDSDLPVDVFDCCWDEDDV